MLLALGGCLAAVYISSDTKLEFWAAVGAVLGVVLFVRGFLMLRLGRLIMNTPSSKIRSASMGLVEISGVAKGPSTIPSGITGQACYYYRAIAWQLRQSGRNRAWKQVACESLYVPFFVEDATGKLLVDPQGADLDIQRNFKDEFDTSFLSSHRDMLPENIAKFLARNGVSFTESVRLEEYCLKPDFPLFVFGTLANNPHRYAGDPVPHVGAGSSLISRFSISGFAGGRLVPSYGSFPGIAVALTNATLSVSRNSTASRKPTSPVPARALASGWSSVSMDEAAMRRHSPQEGQANSPQQPMLASGQTNLAAPVATAEPDPAVADLSTSPLGNGGFDFNPPVCITQGPNKDPFMICWRSQREVVQSLAWKSALCIWGGPALTLACLYFLAVTLRWR